MSGQFDFTVGQIGARIGLQIVRRDPISKQIQPLDISAATTFDIRTKSPITGTIMDYASSGGAVIFTPPPDGAGDGTDGLIEAVTTTNTDLPEQGMYEVNARIVLPGEDGFTQIGTLTVGPIL